MADKKITDLQLRSDVDDDVNFPVDDTIQSYRVTAPQVKTFILGQFIDPKFLLNYSIVASVAANALTIAIKNALGLNPSAASPFKVYFRSATAADGDTDIISHAAALSTVISSGSTGGHESGVDEWIYLYAANNAGAMALAWSSNGSWDEGSLHNTTAEGGAGAADSKYLLYSTSALTGVAIRYLGRMLSNQATAGTWVSTMAEISLQPAPRIPFMALSASSGGFSTTSGSYTQVTNMDLTVHNNGKKRFEINFISDGSGSEGQIAATISGASVLAVAHWRINRNGTAIAHGSVGIVANSGQTYGSIGQVRHIDLTPDAGDNQYTLEMYQSNNGAGATAYFQQAKMLVREI